MAGYSGTPLIKKLGVKPGHKLIVVSAPQEYESWLGPLPQDATEVSLRTKSGIHFIHLFVKDRKSLSRDFVKLKSRMAKDGMMWISWPKQSSGMKTDLDGNQVREYGLKNGLVDVKVCAVSDTWSGLKFVYRVADR